MFSLCYAITSQLLSSTVGKHSLPEFKESAGCALNFILFFSELLHQLVSVLSATEILTFQTYFYPLFSKDTELTQSHCSLPPPSLPDKQLLNHLVNSIRTR